MWVYIILVVLLIYAIIKEREALGCSSNICQDCDNQNGKAVKGTKPDETDTTDEIYDKIYKAATFTDRFVTWRIGYIVGFFAAILVVFLLYQSFPTELELLVITLVVGILIYFTFSFYNFHLIKCIEKNIRESAAILQKRGQGAPTIMNGMLR